MVNCKSQISFGYILATKYIQRGEKKVQKEY